MTGSIFVSYRRNDAAADARQVAATLTQAFGPKSVFMDVNTMGPGARFKEVLEDAVGKCHAMVVVIGREWSSADNLAKLQRPDDYVRREVGTALVRRVPVIPVLVNGASLPSAARLPKDLEALPEHNAIDVRHTSFDADVARLVDGLKALGLSPIRAPSRTQQVRGIQIPDRVNVSNAGQGRAVVSTGNVPISERATAAPVTPTGADGRSPHKAAWIGFWGLVLAAILTSAVMVLTSDSPRVNAKDGVAGGRDTNEPQSQETTGDYSPAIVANGDVTVTYGLTADEILMLRKTIKKSEANIVEYIRLLVDATQRYYIASQNANRNLFEDFVEPIHISFEAIHKDYLKTFKNYRHVLKNSDAVFNLSHPVWGLIQEDHIFTDGSREKLKMMTGRFSSYRDKFHSEYAVSGPGWQSFPPEVTRDWVSGSEMAQVKESPTMDYIARIIFYLTIPRSKLGVDKYGIANPYAGNIPRYELFNELERILSDQRADDKTKKAEAISAIDSIVKDLQKQYEAISIDYVRCKETLLN